MDNYYIEIRYFGKAKYNFKKLSDEVNHKFNLRTGHQVPHITVVQPFSTKKQGWLISDFKRICSQYKLMDFTVDNFGVFPFFVVYVKVKPSEGLLSFRKRLMNKLKSYCRIRDINRDYKPHTTIALNMGLIKFFRIWWYLRKKPRIVFTNHIMRVTLLKGKKILYEYDFTNKRLLNRRQAKSKKVLSKTFRRLKSHKRK